MVVVTKGLVFYRASFVSSHHPNTAMGVECLLDPHFISRHEAIAMNFVRCERAVGPRPAGGSTPPCRAMGRADQGQGQVRCVARGARGGLTVRQQPRAVPSIDGAAAALGNIRPP